jgi:hypothetical protein
MLGDWAKKLTRRQFLCSMGAGAITLTSPNLRRRVGRTYFTWAQLRHSGVWDPNPNGPERLMTELRRRTSVEPGVRRRVVGFGDPELFNYPFLYVTGRGGFADPGSEGALWLRRYVEYGGFILFDDASGISDSGFYRSVVKLLEGVFPERRLKPLQTDHTLYQSFYLIGTVPGRKIVRPVLTGIEREDLTPVVFCYNDLGGAWDGDILGGYTNPCVPGGERQREMSFRLGINFVMYSLTGNYKKDQVHIPFILKRRKRL